MGHHSRNTGQQCAGGFTPQEFQFGEFTLDESRYRLQRGTHYLRLEKLPMDLLILLVQRHGELVSREEIAGRLWGKDVFVDVDHSINTAVRKIRVALRDDPEKPRFVETVVGKGYRFSAPVTCRNGDGRAGPRRRWLGRWFGWGKRCFLRLLRFCGVLRCLLRGLCLRALRRTSGWCAACSCEEGVVSAFYACGLVLAGVVCSAGGWWWGFLGFGLRSTSGETRLLENSSNFRR